MACLFETEHFKLKRSISKGILFALSQVVATFSLDKTSTFGIVTGGRPIRPNEADMRWIGAIVSRNAEVIETGLGAAVLNHPAMGVAWLVNRLAEYGDGLSAGEVVLSGSFIRPIEAVPGSTIVGDYGPFGTVSVYFEH